MLREQDRRFYVTSIRDNRQVAWLLGPYKSKEEAEKEVARGRELACKADPFCDFDAFGVSSVINVKITPVFGK